MKAAVGEIKKSAKKIIIAVPVAPTEAAEELEQITDGVVCPFRERFFLGAIGVYYRNFDQVTDEEVKRVLQNSQIRNLNNE